MPNHAAAAAADEVPVCPITGAPLSRPKRRWGRRVLLIAAGAMLLLFAIYLLATTPFGRALEPVARPSLTFLAADGQPIARRGVTMEAPVDPDTLPIHVAHAFMAIEDRRFLEHGGVDPQGLARAALRNLTAGGVREGGSTITQQLARMAALTNDRTAMRKLREMLLAWWLELNLSKEEILVRYMSNAYYGDGVYGLRAAARHYFDKPPEELSIGEAAMLAGLVNAPSRLAPTRNLDGARERARLVVRTMVESGMLSEERAEALPKVELDVSRVRRVPSGTYFTDWVAGELDQSEAARVEIMTTLDRRLQRLAAAAARRAPAGAQVAIVSMRTDGSVVAMVGGRDYGTSAFNRVTQARRQPGSAFKLFVYLTALREGMRPDSPLDDSPITIDGWTPENYDGRYRGPITMREAFAVSANAATVRLAERVGRADVIRTARDLGLTTALEPRPSLALGAAEATLLEMTAAYAAVAAGAYPVRPRGLGLQESEAEPEGRFDRETLMPAMLDLLWQSANAGTGRAAALSTPTFGKTGTSQDNRDAVFIGFAGGLVTGVWIGRDDNQPLGDVSGGGLPAEIWRDYMAGALRTRAAALREAPRADPPPPPPGRGRDDHGERRDRDWWREREREWERDREKGRGEREGRGNGRGNGKRDKKRD